MVYLEQEGEYFASIFQSVARQKEENEEREQIKKMLDLLDELETQEPKQQMVPMHPQMMYPMQPMQPMHPQMMYPYYYHMVPQQPIQPKPVQNVEFYKVITEDGDILETDTASLKAIDRNKVHTIDDLPKENEWDAIFGPPSEEEPLINVQAGRRLKDGEKFFTARVRGEPMYAQWNGISFASLLTFLILGVALIVLFTRLNRLSSAVPPSYQAAPPKNIMTEMDIQRFIFQQVDKRMSEKYNLNASHFQ